MNIQELLITLIPSITAILATITAVITFIVKVKSIVKDTNTENLILQNALVVQQAQNKKLFEDNAELKAEIHHLLNKLNKVLDEKNEVK